MHYDFDQHINRHNTDSMKWRRYEGQDVVPMWVADMDFQAAPPILSALSAQLEHGVLGYTLPSKALVQSVVEHLSTDYGWSVQPGWIVWLPGVVPGLAAACRAVGQDGDSVLTSSPIYHHFFEVAGEAGKQLIDVPLVQGEDQRWFFNESAIRQQMSATTSLMLLCNPHNPVGRVFQKGELQNIAALAAEHNTVVVSDEIHCGLVLDKQQQHVPFAVAAPDYAHRTITLMSPTKTFNIAGLGVAFAVVPDPELRRSFRAACHNICGSPSGPGVVASLAAYRDGQAWQRELQHYLWENWLLIKAFVEQQPMLDVTPLEATYLAWIDVQRLPVENPTRFFEDAGVGLSPGEQFGDKRFLRMNFGCPRETVELALSRMEKALAAL